MIEVLLWYALITMVGFLALPLAHRFLRFLPDRGYTMARALGILLWGFCYWLLASLGLLQNDLGGVLLALILVGTLAAWAGRGWRDALEYLKGRPRLVLIGELLFLVAFVGWAVVRSADPGINTTEKPMELAFINAILRSPAFPPNDPWLSGYAISYYYFGYVMVAMLARVTGVIGAVAFNLAIALWFALTALGVYGVAYNLLAVFSRRRQAAGKPAIFSQGWALLAPLFLLLVSNFGGFFEVLHSGGAFWTESEGKLQSSFWQWVNIKEWNQPPSLPFEWKPDFNRGWWWWQSSRIVQDFDASGNWKEIIDEFPFFSYYLADLHPHLLSMPFILLAIALAFNLYLAGKELDFARLGLRQWIRQADFWLAGVSLGALAFLNIWDFPIYLALFSAVFIMVRYQQVGWHWINRFKEFFGLLVALGAAGVLLYLPFYFGFASQAGGIVPSMVFFTRGVYFWIMFGPLLFPIFGFLLWLWKKQGGRWSGWAGLRFGLAVVFGLWAASFLLGWIGGSLPGIGSNLAESASPVIARVGQSLREVGQLFLSVMGAQDAGSLVMTSLGSRLANPGTWLTLGALITLTWGLLTSFRKPVTPAGMLDDENDNSSFEPLSANPHLGSPYPFILLMVLVGAGLTLAPEFVYLRDQFGWRMNTIFKFYFQSWNLWAVAAAVCSVVLLKELDRTRWPFALAWFGVVGMALFYPFFALSGRLDFTRTSTWTLDGGAYIAQFNQDEMDAIRFLRSVPVGVVAEAVGGSYRPEYARIATHTGLQNVLGWPGHESQWRGGAKEIGSREQDIDRLYRSSSWEETLSILQQYQIRYIFIGGVERSKYRVNDAKFKTHLAAIFERGDVVVYEVPELLLADGHAILQGGR